MCENVHCANYETKVGCDFSIQLRQQKIWGGCWVKWEETCIITVQDAPITWESLSEALKTCSAGLLSITSHSYQ